MSGALALYIALKNRQKKPSKVDKEDVAEDKKMNTCVLKDFGGSYECGNCGAFIDTHASYDMIGIPHVNYCPNCGAKVTGFKPVA